MTDTTRDRVSGQARVASDGIETPAAAKASHMESRDRRSADQRLFVAAAGHHALVADRHDDRAARHERDGEEQSAARELTLAQQARDKAQQSRDLAERSAR
jgi:hypothetical protein